MEDALGKIIDEVGGVIAAVAVAVTLRWAARRWPLPGEDDRPRRRRRYEDLADEDE
jgi:hypothetical protein